MDSFVDMMRASDPVSKVDATEQDKYFRIFCSYMCILNNKKLNLANIFLLLLDNASIRELFKQMCDFETDYDCLKFFLQRDPTLHKSKYIKNYLQQTSKPLDK